MEFRPIGRVIIAVVLTVFAWSVVMAVAGQVAAVATLAPALGVTVQQIASALRPQAGAAPGRRVEDAAVREEDSAP
ncbi:hypothetical protein ABZ770_37790 [Streptomyces sp. NPDC006654]|uniref:hypothetical protein n=1 Tax=Streptomyces sp. NPDC006654 TaxID=3156897 RepID=UPI003405A1F7